MTKWKRWAGALAAGMAAAVLAVSAAMAGPDGWRHRWPNTDFTQYSIDYHEIISGGPPRDGIPSIDDPTFVPVGDRDIDLVGTEPVIVFALDGVARAYPLRILMFHEIVNDVVAGQPVAVTYCPLCNASIVFDRTVNGTVLEFGTTGLLRNSDLVMYDRATESWWQQFVGTAIVGEMTGAVLAMLPSQVVPYREFADRYPDGEVLVPPRATGSYGRNPYVDYDTSSWPFLFDGDYYGDLAPLDYVLKVGEQAWSLALLRQQGTIQIDGMTIRWEPGMNSALDASPIPMGRDIGYVYVNGPDGAPVVHDVTFAFAFYAFHPDGTIHHIE